MHEPSSDQARTDRLPELTSYDRLVYESFPYGATHPDRACTLARLFGLSPAPVGRSRVLEIGCGAGGNLIPMAESLPGSEFVGIDLASTQIARGQATIERLGLRNITLHAMDLATLEGQFGEFDYVLAHGVYSWIPDAAKDRLLAINARVLRPHGIGFVSYNTLPGWHLRGMVRDMALHHATRVDESADPVRQARALLEFLVNAQPRSDTFYSLLLKREREVLARESDGYVAHEMLEPNNDPVYFTEFATRLHANGLQYLGEADFNMMLPNEFAPSVVETLGRICADVITMEQYLDFLRCRAFRQSLVCRAGVPVARELFPTRVSEFWLATTARPAGDTLDLTEGLAQTFKVADGASLQILSGIAKAAFIELSAAWPERLSLPELCRRARERLGPSPTSAEKDELMRADAESIGSALLHGFSVGMVQLFTEPAPFALVAAERPRASSVVRDQIASGEHVTNRRHELLRLDVHMRRVAQLADGTRDRAAILREAQAMSPALDPAFTAPMIDVILARMVRLALLVD